MSETISYTQAFNKITEQMQSLYYDKNRDYGNSFAVTWEKLGPISGLTRMSDKFNRLCSLMTSEHGPWVKSESIEDTLMDLACYSVMAIIEMQKDRKALNVK